MICDLQKKPAEIVINFPSVEFYSGYHSSKCEQYNVVNYISLHDELHFKDVNLINYHIYEWSEFRPS